MSKPELPAPTEEGEPDAFAVSVSSSTDAETFTVHASDTLHSLQLLISLSKLEAPVAQQRLVLDGEPLAEDMDMTRTLASHGICGPAAVLQLVPQDAGEKLKSAVHAEAVEGVRAAVEPCIRPVRMKLRKANGKHKHRRWFWLTTGEDDQGIVMHWSPHEDGSSDAPHEQRRVAAMWATDEGRSGLLGLTVDVSGDESGPVKIVAENEDQRWAWLTAWHKVQLAAARGAAGAAAVDAGVVTIDGVQEKQAVAAGEEQAKHAASVEAAAKHAGYVTVLEQPTAPPAPEDKKEEKEEEEEEEQEEKEAQQLNQMIERQLQFHDKPGQVYNDDCSLTSCMRWFKKSLCCCCCCCDPDFRCCDGEDHHPVGGAGTTSEMWWMVPPGVTSATIEAVGATGHWFTASHSDDPNNPGGSGARVRGVFALVPGTMLRLIIATDRGGRSCVLNEDGSPLLLAGQGGSCEYIGSGSNDRYHAKLPTQATLDELTDSMVSFNAGAEPFAEHARDIGPSSFGGLRTRRRDHLQVRLRPVLYRSHHQTCHSHHGAVQRLLLLLWGYSTSRRSVDTY
eukprot:COSAG06_NODE_2493_length_6765_cov_3.175668_4_plen_563_part_00